MMMHVGMNENLKTDMLPECMATTNKLENIMVKPHKEKRSYENFYGNILDYEK